MEILLISITAFLAAILTFFSGFGLGTLLTPVFMVFFPVEMAIALTGVVHLFNNIFKLVLVGKHANKEVLWRFGAPAVIFAFVGAWLLINLEDTEPVFQYSLMGNTFSVYQVKFLIAVLLMVFALMDLIPWFRKLEFGRDKLPIGGAMSGFFGGLSGNQGALRSAFLIRAGMSKEAFIGTAVVVSSLVDFTRIGVYASSFSSSGLMENLQIVIPATLAAISGAFIGNKLLKKITLSFIRNLVAVLLILIALGLALGLL
jgi:uncharacterized protein